MRSIALQRDFAAHIRDPERCAAPEGIEDRRMRIYRELFLDNLTGLLAGGFPVVHAIVGPERWSALVRGFLRDHRCRTPLFAEIPQEFLAYLAAHPDELPADRPFIRELAHYEWVEVALDLSPLQLPTVGIETRGDLMEGVPVLSPLAWPLAYRYPVHRLSPSFQPQQPPDEVSCYVAWRNRSDTVRFMAINPVTHRLVEAMRDPGGLRGRELLARIASELPGTAIDTVVSSGRDALETLREVEVILGTRPVA